MRAIVTILAVLSLAGAALAADVCIVDSPGGNNTIDCVNNDIWSNSYRGYSTDGTPCEAGLCGFSPQRGANEYRWMISASDTDPYVNAGPLAEPVANLYLWLECSVGDGMAAAELSIEVTGAGPNSTYFVHVATDMLPGFLNAGTHKDLAIVAGGCPVGPVLAARMTFLNLGPVSVEPESWAGIKSMYR